VPTPLLDTPFPAMALLTLVENAVRHGIDPSERGGRIDIRARCAHSGGELRVGVADTGVGLRETAPGGTGLANLRSRLTAFFGADARLELHEVEPTGLRAEIVVTPAGAPPR
jgi:LytS/YehU family sensor histidine kinase